MQTAYAEIMRLSGDSSANIDWEMEEFVFNRLFIGPAAPIAPKVASVYLDPEGCIQGRITGQVKGFYESVGLCLADMGREPEDTLEYELDACRYLLLLSEEVPEALEAYREFMNGHIALWVPLFAGRALCQCGGSYGVKRVLEKLSEWVLNESDVTLVSKERV